MRERLPSFKVLLTTERPCRRTTTNQTDKQEETMAIYLVTHRKGGSSAEVIPAVSRLKALATKHGAEDLQLHTEVAGPAAGQWVLAIKFSDWASYGKAMESAQADPAARAALADLDKITEMTSRRLGVGVD